MRSRRASRARPRPSPPARRDSRGRSAARRPPDAADPRLRRSADVFVVQPFTERQYIDTRAGDWDSGFGIRREPLSRYDRPMPVAVASHSFPKNPTLRGELLATYPDAVFNETSQPLKGS